MKEQTLLEALRQNLGQTQTQRPCVQVNSGSMPKTIWDPKYTPREFLERAKEQ